MIPSGHLDKVNGNRVPGKEDRLACVRIPLGQTQIRSAVPAQQSRPWATWKNGEGAAREDRQPDLSDQESDEEARECQGKRERQVHVATRTAQNSAWVKASHMNG